jgi:DNA-binding NarL/FixJ family response regulator
MRRTVLVCRLRLLLETFDGQTLEQAWTAGRKLRLDQAVEEALAGGGLPPVEPGRHESSPDGRVGPLTPSESEVAALVAQGLSNRQNADRLVITDGTVAAHVEHILDKLAFTSRTQIGVWAAERDLAASSFC